MTQQHRRGPRNAAVSGRGAAESAVPSTGSSAQWNLLGQVHGQARRQAGWADRDLFIQLCWALHWHITFNHQPLCAVATEVSCWPYVALCESLGTFSDSASLPLLAIHLKYASEPTSTAANFFRPHHVLQLIVLHRKKLNELLKKSSKCW